jgi:uncharacterized protein YyaL (SSP411 family)
MAKRESMKLQSQLKELRRGRLLWFQLYAPWSAESETWRQNLNADSRFHELLKECSYFESPVEEWIDEAQGFQAFSQYHTGYSGWPLNLFLNKAGRAVFICGSLEIPAVVSLTAALFQAYHLDSRALDEEAEKKYRDFHENDPQNLSKFKVLDSAEIDQQLSAKNLQRMLTPLEQSMDLETGLIGGETVFHFPSILRALVLSDEERSWAETFLVRLARSPLYDVVGGGFFRSLNRKDSRTSTEKLLVENVELLDVLLEFLAIQKHPFLEEIAAQTLDLLRKEFRSEKGYASALAASNDFYEWETRDLFSALGADERGVAQKFFGVSATRKTIPFIATEVTSLSKDWNLEPLDLRLKLLDVRRKLQSYAEKNRRLARPRELPAKSYATALAVATLARAAFSWDIPELFDDCREVLSAAAEKRELNEDLKVRERWAWARAHLAMARTEFHMGSKERASELVTWVEDELLMESDFQKVGISESTVFGKRLDLSDHLGTSAGALFLHTLMDLKTLQKKGIVGKRSLPLDERQPLATALQQSRTLGINAGGIYSALARFLKGL